jgi:hypothetical protein
MDAERLEGVEVIDPSMLERKVIPELLSRAAERIRQNPPGQRNRFWREKAIHLREGRLIALAYPDLMERIASEYALNSLNPPLERYYMMFMLGYLAEAQRPNARSVLVQLANDSDPITSVRAIYVLWPSDRAGEFRDIYMRKALEGNVEAFKVLSFTADSGSASFMKENAARSLDGSTVAFDIKESARTALTRYDLLQSPDWQLKLADVIMKEEPYTEVSWAIEAARRNSFSELPALIRKKLDIATDQMRTFDKRIADNSEGFRPSFESRYTSEGRVNGMPLFLDDLLVMQQQLGGPLTDLEKARLRTFGYGVDSNVRLRELLTTGK